MKITFGNLGKILRCGFRLKCPQCGEGALFQTFFTMFTRCRACNLKFERESGYFIGAMYLNYGATVLIAFPSYFLFETFTAIPFFSEFGCLDTLFRRLPYSLLSLFKKSVAQLRLRFLILIPAAGKAKKSERKSNNLKIIS